MVFCRSVCSWVGGEASDERYTQRRLAVGIRLDAGIRLSVRGARDQEGDRARVDKLPQHCLLQAI
jgi:hypothetical protein